MQEISNQLQATNLQLFSNKEIITYNKHIGSKKNSNT